jgi:ABC-type nickel/cobalt efflux system permease component RcnA
MPHLPQETFSEISIGCPEATWLTPLAADCPALLLAGAAHPAVTASKRTRTKKNTLFLVISFILLFFIGYLLLVDSLVISLDDCGFQEI